MKPSSLDTLIWVLIYGGLLLLSLGIFVARSSNGLGAALGVAGGLAALVGVVLIFVRSRMRSDA